MGSLARSWLLRSLLLRVRLGLGSLSLSLFFFGFFFEGFFSAVESDLIAQSAEESRGGEAGKVSLLGLGLSKRGLSPLPDLCPLSNFYSTQIHHNSFHFVNH
jgi:hypothetical protein